MARTKGALNKRTRAALHGAQTGSLNGGGDDPIAFLLRLMRDSRKPDELRIEAAKAVAPYLQPKLSAVEVTRHEPAEEIDEVQIIARIEKQLNDDPALRAQLLALSDGLAKPAEE